MTAQTDKTAVPEVDNLAFITATQLAQREYGDQAVLSEPYFDKNKRIFADIVRNGKVLDHVYLGENPKDDLSEIYPKLTPPNNPAWDGLVKHLDEVAKHPEPVKPSSVPATKAAPAVQANAQSK